MNQTTANHRTNVEHVLPRLQPFLKHVLIFSQTDGCRRETLLSELQFAKEERTRRIVDAAVELAERGGFEAVRLRDVAAQANVALATVYKRFRSKEDLMMAALARDAEAFERLLSTNPVAGPTAVERTITFFGLATEVFCSKPNLARAVLRAVSSGDPDLTQKVAQFQSLVARLINQAIGGTKEPTHPLAHDVQFALLLQRIWFASLVGWMGGLHGIPEVSEQMRFAIERLIPAEKDRAIEPVDSDR